MNSTQMSPLAVDQTCLPYGETNSMKWFLYTTIIAILGNFNQVLAGDLPIDDHDDQSDYGEWQTSKTDFFENSSRRNASQDEKKSIARFWSLDSKDKPKGWCTAFFIKNNKNKILMATARHCADYKFTEACEKQKFRLELATDRNLIGRCRGIIVGGNQDDLIIFEADFKKDIRRQIKPLTLGYNTPPKNTKLRMIGYPGDKFRKGRLTVTENCWINDGRRTVEFSDLDEKARKAYPTFKTSNEKALLQSYISSTILYSNCTVYGGNSGGPVLLEGTNIVIGLPAAYWPEFYLNLNSSISMRIHSSDTFIRRNQTKINENGVEIIDIDKALSI